MDQRFIKFVLRGEQVRETDQRSHMIRHGIEDLAIVGFGRVHLPCVLQGEGGGELALDVDGQVGNCVALSLNVLRWVGIVHPHLDMLRIVARTGTL